MQHYMHLKMEAVETVETPENVAVKTAFRQKKLGSSLIALHYFLNNHKKFERFYTYLLTPWSIVLLEKLTGSAV